MRFVKIKSDFFNLCKEKDNEVLQKVDRPYVLVLKLKYNGIKTDFAIPLRSNISAGELKMMYYALPTRFKTKLGNRHGLHFRKIVPVKKSNLEKYIVFENNNFDKMIQEYIEKNIKDIIIQAQSYLDYYDKNKPLKFATNIDELMKLLVE